jgi:hypothetical protein
LVPWPWGSAGCPGIHDATGSSSRSGAGAERELFAAFVGPAKGNATEAARLAGYKGNDVTVAAVGYENLKKPQVAEAAKERLEQALSEFAADDVIRHVGKIAFSPKERTGDRLRG